MANLLLIGINGTLGSALAKEASNRRIAWEGTSRRENSRWRVDLAEPEETWNLPPKSKVAIICSAITNIDECENNPVQSRKINVDSTIRLIDRLASLGTNIVFLSSTRVFPPTFEHPSEFSTPAPATEYGRHKFDVEQYIIRNHPDAKIIRPAKIIYSHLPLILAWKQTLSSNCQVKPYHNLHLSPSDLSHVVDAVLQISFGRHSGIFHLAASDAISYVDLAFFLVKQFGYNTRLIQPIPAPYPNTMASTILKCDWTIKNSSFSPRSSEDYLKAAFGQKMHTTSMTGHLPLPCPQPS